MFVLFELVYLYPQMFFYIETGVSVPPKCTYVCARFSILLIIMCLSHPSSLCSSFVFAPPPFMCLSLHVSSSSPFCVSPPIRAKRGRILGLLQGLESKLAVGQWRCVVTFIGCWSEQSACTQKCACTSGHSGH